MKLVQKMRQLLALVNWLGNNFFAQCCQQLTTCKYVGSGGGGPAAKWLEGKNLVEDPVHDILNAKLRLYFKSIHYC